METRKKNRKPAAKYNLRQARRKSAASRKGFSKRIEKLIESWNPERLEEYRQRVLKNKV